MYVEQVLWGSRLLKYESFLHFGPRILYIGIGIGMREPGSLIVTYTSGIILLYLYHVLVTPTFRESQKYLLAPSIRAHFQWRAKELIAIVLYVQIHK